MAVILWQPLVAVQKSIAHPTLKPITDPLLELRAVLRGKALMRLKYEGKDKAPELSNPDSRWYNDPEGYAEDLFAYYMCFKCKKPYYGGERVCGEAGGAFDPTELVCGGCSPWSGDIDCPKHGKDFIEFKCRWCCSVAVRRDGVTARGHDDGRGVVCGRVYSCLHVYVGVCALAGVHAIVGVFFPAVRYRCGSASAPRISASPAIAGRG